MDRHYYHCDIETGLVEAVTSWRLAISADCYSSDERSRAIANRLAQQMEEHAACDPGTLLHFATARLNHHDSGKPNTKATSHLPLVNGETVLLERIINAASNSKQRAKLAALLKLLREGGDPRSFIVFANQIETADRIYRFLADNFPPGRVLRHSTANRSWTQFKSERTGFVLICDQDAEEGLNLQKRGAILIHYDMPFSPNRIEQRMGRLDRFGVGRPVPSIALVCDDSEVQKQWCNLLDSSLGVFNRSVASLQYVIEEEMNVIWSSFLDSGGDAFKDAAEELGGDNGRVAVEFRKIQAQDAIDSFDSDASATASFEKLEVADRRLSRGSPAIFDRWLVSRLSFERRGEENRSDSVFSYSFTRRDDFGRGRPSKDTLLSLHEFTSRFSESLDTIETRPPVVWQTVPMTFDRVDAQQRSTRLLRVGDPFVDNLEELTRWDDRGICYAFWRLVRDFDPVEDPDVFFRFDYVVSPDPEPLRELCKRTSGVNLDSLLRQTRAIMTPGYTTIWLDSDSERVDSNDSRFQFLAPPFNKHPNNRSQDFSLNSDRWKGVSRVYDMSLWRDRCIDAGKPRFALIADSLAI